MEARQVSQRRARLRGPRDRLAHARHRSGRDARGHAHRARRRFTPDAHAQPAPQRKGRGDRQHRRRRNLVRRVLRTGDHRDLLPAERGSLADGRLPRTCGVRERLSDAPLPRPWRPAFVRRWRTHVDRIAHVQPGPLRLPVHDDPPRRDSGPTLGAGDAGPVLQSHSAGVDRGRQDLTVRQTPTRGRLPHTPDRRGQAASYITHGGRSAIAARPRPDTAYALTAPGSP